MSKRRKRLIMALSAVFILVNAYLLLGNFVLRIKGIESHAGEATSAAITTLKNHGVLSISDKDDNYHKIFYDTQDSLYSHIDPYSMQAMIAPLLNFAWSALLFLIVLTINVPYEKRNFKIQPGRNK